jgi:signal transduction histidine kinase
MVAISQLSALDHSSPRAAASSVDARMVALMRCILVISGLAIIYIDPTEPARYVQLTYLSVSAYCVWSLAQLVAAHRGWTEQSPWIDVAWATFLVALTQGTGSIFFFLFLFAILVASFSRGYRAGVTMAAVSSFLFVVVGWIFAPEGDNFELNRSLIRPVYLLALGWMVAVWGDREIVLRRRLAFLRDITSQWNPRLGVGRTIQANLESIVAFFSAEQCVLALKRSGAGHENAILYRTGSSLEDAAGPPTVADPRLSATLLDCPAPFVLSPGGPEAARRREADPASREGALTNLFDGSDFAAVRYVQADGSAGRLFVVRRGVPFMENELAFLEQVAAAISHVVENTQLIDELVIKAAEHERFRISLDIHDSTVQPYIGLKLGLDALLRESGGNPLEARVADLLAMADATIHDLRGFATGIRERTPISGDSLLKAALEQAERFRRFYGVEVELEFEQNLFVSPHTASEAFRMISEGLSNVMRHTTSRVAFVRVFRAEKELRLVIANAAWGNGGKKEPFTPRSINARALSLGGSSFVEHSDDGRSAVHISIPA